MRPQGPTTSHQPGLQVWPSCTKTRTSFRANPVRHSQGRRSQDRLPLRPLRQRRKPPAAHAERPLAELSRKEHEHLPEKLFFLVVSLGLFSSTLTGIYMAYKFDRNKWLVTGLLIAGIAVPLVLLPF